MQTIAVTSDGSAGQAARPTRLAQRDVSYPTVNLGPMTSAFRPPPGCDSFTLSYSGEAVVFDYGRTCAGTASRQLKASCYPPRYAAAWNAQLYPVFSPASVCPSGYAPACEFAGVPSTADASFAQQGTDDFDAVMAQILAPTERAVACCPSGYACWLSPAYHCLRSISTSRGVIANPNTDCKSHDVELAKYVLPNDVSMYAQAPCVMLVDSLPSTRTGTITSTNTFASSVSSEAVSASESEISSISSGSSTGNGTGNSTSTGNSNDGNISANSGLSTGAKAAIGACIPLVAIFAGLALFAFLRRRSRRNATTDTNADGAPTTKESSAYDTAKMGSSNTRQTTTSGSLMPPDRSYNVSPGASVGGASELQGSTVSPRLHEHIMELPANCHAHGPAGPRTDRPSSFN